MSPTTSYRLCGIAMLTAFFLVVFILLPNTSALLIASRERTETMDEMP